MNPPPILGPDGRPAPSRLRREAARPTAAGVRQAWTGETVAAGLTPERLAAVLKAADSGEPREFLTLAEEIEERYPHYASVLGTRRRAVSGLRPAVEPAGDGAGDLRLAEEVRAVVHRADFAALLDDLLDGLGKGWAAVEILWNRDDGARWSPERFVWRDPRHFRWDRADGQTLRLLDDKSPDDGRPLEPFKWIVHRPRLKSGLPVRGGLARVACWAYLITAYAITDWTAFVEVFGHPLRLGRYNPESAREEDIRTLITALANLGTDAAAAIPETMRIEFQDGARSGGSGGAVFEKLAAYMDRQVSKAVLGQTMTTDDGSSRAQAEVHDHVRGDILRADARQLAETLNRDLVRPFLRLNFGEPERFPRLELPVPDPAGRAAFTAAVRDLAPLGLRIPAAAVRARLDLPEPEDGAEVLGPAPADPAAPAAARNAEPPPALNREGPPPDADPLAELEAEYADDWERQMDPVVAPVRAALAEADSLEAARDALPEAIPRMDDRRLARRLGAAAFTARGLGDADA